MTQADQLRALVEWCPMVKHPDDIAACLAGAKALELVQKLAATDPCYAGACLYCEWDAVVDSERVHDPTCLWQQARDLVTEQP